MPCVPPKEVTQQKVGLLLRTVEVNDVNMMSAHQRFGIANKDVTPRPRPSRLGTHTRGRGRLKQRPPRQRRAPSQLRYRRLASHVGRAQRCFLLDLAADPRQSVGQTAAKRDTAAAARRFDCWGLTAAAILKVTHGKSPTILHDARRETQLDPSARVDHARHASASRSRAFR